MAYRSGTYIAFHADGETNPTVSDMKYYTLLKEWKVRDDDFSFVNSHEKLMRSETPVEKTHFVEP